MLNDLDIYNKTLNKKILKSINKTVHENNFIFGKSVTTLEKKLSKLTKAKYVTTVGSGTDAIFLSLLSLDLKKNDEIIIPNFTIISNVLPGLKLGIKMKFIDCGIYDWNFDLNKLKKAITSKTKVIIATHIYNYPIRMDLLRKICEEKKIIIIEDAAEVLGQKLFDKRCGSFGDISTFSFYANKQITTGEGGMITTNNKKLYQKFSSLRNLAFGIKNRFNHDDIGWNYRMTNIQATLGISQLKRIGSIIKKRHSIGKRYYENLKLNKNIYIPEPKKKFSYNIYWVIGVVVINKKLNLDASKIMSKLKSMGIGTRPFFWPMNKQKILRRYNFKKSDFINSEFISNYGFYLPTSLTLKNSEIDYVCK